ncbi:MAG: hypothetical protein WBG73_13210 [Coleofasciculaceae cyanobacterium]
MKPIYLLGLTTLLISQTALSQAEAYPISATPRIRYLAKISAQDLVNRAIARAQSSDNQGAIADLTAAIEMDKDLAVAYHYRGIVRVAMGDKPGAIADFQSAALLFQKQGKMNDYQISVNAIAYLQR